VGFIRIIFICAVVLFLFVVRSFQKNAESGSAITLAFVAGTCYLGPVYIFYWGDVYKHVDIAAAAVAVTSVMVAVVAAFLTNLTGRVRWPGVWLIAPAVIWLAIGTWISWGRSAEHDAGLAHLGVGFVAWLVGASCAYLLGADQRARERATVYLTGLLVIQAVVVFGQVIGFNINPMSPDQLAILGGRYNGLLSHPAQLATATLIIFALILALRDTSTSWRDGRTAAVFALVIGLCIAAGSRAQILGAFLLLVGWAFFAYGQRVPVGKRFGALGMACVGLLVSYPVLQRRFDEDPTGGARSILQEIGLQAVMNHPLMGVGPNSYVSVVGLSDALTASGVPVHNAFLLAAAEVGIAGAVALWLPVLWTFVRGFRLRKEVGIVQAPAAAAAAFFAPFVLTTFTGWGLLSDPLWALLMLAMGAIYALMSAHGADEEVLTPVLQHRGRS
jgi:O-antigen ligase